MTEPSDTSQRRVRRLPDALVDRIAAGEVVERPASVVKELVENALDAGARRLRVEIRAGGRDWIAITDDGCGMTPEDARLALERHATSKLDADSDLARIASYGFRGEALPAIASVSSLRLRTRRADAAEAFELSVEAGAGVTGRAAGGPPGTRVEVGRLFEAVPARRKFLKSPQTEWGHVADVVTRAALARPDVHFDVHRDDKPAFSWPAADDPLDRIAAVLGEHEAGALVRVEHEEGRVRVEGYVSRPDRHRATAAGIHLFVNQRPVRDRTLQHALVEVYRDVLPRGRYPSAVLFLDVPFEAVDVNVHPAKTEVRFADAQSAHRWVRHAVRSAFAARDWLSRAPEPPSFSGAAADPRTFAGEAASRSPGAATSRVAEAETDWIFARAQPSAAPPLADAPATDAVGRVRFGDLRLLGQLLATYLLVESKQGLLLVDQHAAHERVLYERLRADWLSRGVERQGLLAPLTLELDPAAASALAEHAERVLALGFEVEPFGESTVAVRSVPALLGDRDPAQLVRGLADELRDEGGVGEGAAAIRALPEVDRIFATLACHAARRKGDPLEPLEQRALLDAVDSIPWAPTCPHGRPVAIPFELAEIERRFARR
jgi:DNA mismatch repair protein MutL